jgi:flagellar basal-body rod protein FlgG
MGLIEIGGTILSRAAQRVDTCAQNLTNMTTPGYKARTQFSALIAGATDNSIVNAPTKSAGIDFTNGALQTTGNPLDLAISGSGFFAVRDASGTFFTRNGQFSRDSDGHLVTSGGAVLQSLSGALSAGQGDLKILSDGTVLNNDAPVGRIALMAFDDQNALQPAGGSLFSAPQGAAKPVVGEIRQGMLEGSNVSTALEMVSIMADLRSAGAGSHVVQLYDDLMGRAVTAFGQS